MRHRPAQNIHTQQYIPLEDRIFAYSVALFTALVFFALQLNAYVQMNQREQLEQSGAELMASIWEAQTPRAHRKLAYFNQTLPQDSQSLALEDFSLVPYEKFRRYCKNNSAICTIKTSTSEYILVEDRLKFEKGTAVVVPRAPIEALIPKPLSQIHIFLASLSIAAILAVTVRLLLRTVIFSNLDRIIKAVFARRIFDATGSIAKDLNGREIDGRIHFFLSAVAKFRAWYKRSIRAFKNRNNNSTEPIQRFQTITLTRIPEPPRIPIEEFSNDEFGRLALALEEDNQKQVMYEKLFEGLLDNIPVPIIATARDNSFFLVNNRFREIFSIQDTTLPTSGQSPDVKMRSHLAIPENLIANAIRVLDQKSPRVFAKEYTFRTPTHDKIFPVSITTLSKFGKRLAIISIHENLSSEPETIRHALWSLSSRQLDISQTILEKLEEIDDKNFSSLRLHFEAIIDLLNTELDILHGESEEIKHDLVEFSLAQLLSSVAKIMEPNKIELELAESIPRKVVGSPSHIKHFLIAVLHEFFALNQCTAKISAIHSHEESILEITIRSPKKSNKMKDENSLSLIRFLSRSYQISFLENPESSEEFLQFSSSAKVPEKKNELPFTMLKSLKNKKLLVVVSSADACLQQIQIIRNTGSSEIVFHDFPTFRRSDEDFSLYDAAIILSGSMMWQKDLDLLQITEVLKEKAVPVLLVPQTPRRGDSAEATKFGFSGYLRRPFLLSELQEILYTLCNKEALGNVLPKGIITRYAANELTRVTHKAIVAALCSHDEPVANAILTELSALGFSGIVVIGIHELVRQLFENEKAMLFYPAYMTVGQRRQLAIAIEGRATFAYKSSKHVQEKESVTALHDDTVFISPPFTQERILEAISSSLEKPNNKKTAHSLTRKRRSA